MKSSDLRISNCNQEFATNRANQRNAIDELRVTLVTIGVIRVFMHGWPATGEGGQSSPAGHGAAARGRAGGGRRLQGADESACRGQGGQAEGDAQAPGA
eukprot:763527-Pyramimonas_sp.AAC.1